jgi:hypothetical protein
VSELRQRITITIAIDIPPGATAAFVGGSPDDAIAPVEQGGSSSPTQLHSLPAPAAPAPSGGPEWVCPLHGSSKWVPPGVSKKTGREYSGFLACPQSGCDQKPPR